MKKEPGIASMLRLSLYPPLKLSMLDQLLITVPERPAIKGETFFKEVITA